MIFFGAPIDGLADRGDLVGGVLAYGEPISTGSPLSDWVTKPFCKTSTPQIIPCLNLKNKSHPVEPLPQEVAAKGERYEKFPRGEAFAPSKRKCRKNPRGILKGPGPQARSLKAAFFPRVSLQKQRNPEKDS